MKKLSVAVMAVSLIALAGPAQAVVVVWTGAGTDDTFDWSQLGPAVTDVPPLVNVTSNGGRSATLLKSDGGTVVRLDQGFGWNGSFGPGEKLLWNRDAGDFSTIFFAVPVWGAGAQIDANIPGPFTARITTDDGSFFDFAGVQDNAGNDTAPFVGVRSDSANISSISFRMLTTTNANGTVGNDFAISQLDILTGPGNAVPEPAVWAMMIAGFGLAGAAMRYRRRKIALAIGEPALMLEGPGTATNCAL